MRKFVFALLLLGIAFPVMARHGHGRHGHDYGRREYRDYNIGYRHCLPVRPLPPPWEVRHHVRYHEAHPWRERSEFNVGPLPPILVPPRIVVRFGH